MKYGENRHYWPEYVFEAYVNHASDVVYLTGFPDIEASRPHSPVGPGRGGLRVDLTLLSLANRLRLDALGETDTGSSHTPSS